MPLWEDDYSEDQLRLLRERNPAMEPLPSDESLLCGGLQNHASRFPVELLAHRLGPNLDKTLEQMRRTIDAMCGLSG